MLRITVETQDLDKKLHAICRLDIFGRDASLWTVRGDGDALQQTTLLPDHDADTGALVLLHQALHALGIGAGEGEPAEAGPVARGAGE